MLAAREEEARQVRAEGVWETVQRRMAAEPARAEELFQAFSAAPEVRRTRALSRAWLARGDAAPLRWKLHNSRETLADLDGWARALIEAPDQATAMTAVHRMASHLLDVGYGSRIGRMLDAVEAADLPELHDSLVAMRLRSSLWAGDLERAEQAWQEARALGLPEGALFEDPRRLVELTRTGSRVAEGVVHAALRPDLGDGAPVALMSDGETLRRVRLLPDPRVEATWTGPHDPMQVERYVWPTSEEPPEMPAARPVWVDLDGDGVVEGYQADPGRREVLRRVDVGPGGWLTRVAHEPTRRAASVPWVDAGDFDGDGRPALAVGLAEWRAYAVHVLEADASGALHLVARAHDRGPVRLAATPDPWGERDLIATFEVAFTPPVGVSDADAPRAMRNALVLRRQVGAELREVFRLDTDRAWDVDRLVPADLDGDGRSELMASVLTGWGRSLLVLWAGEAPDTFTVSMWPRGNLVGALQADDDPATELLVVAPDRIEYQDGERLELWILGRGSDPVPEAPPPRRRLPEVPAAVRA
ncbi:MAG TPA: VCBS repeat-containing protein, partial [Myxococcota bacterium]|nr:VCBS repeat-containing protein [Myxococcota bacterium]